MLLSVFTKESLSQMDQDSMHYNLLLFFFLNKSTNILFLAMALLSKMISVCNLFATMFFFFNLFSIFVAFGK